MSYSQQEITSHINRVLVELFEVDESELAPQTKLYDDLDIDSIDTIDLLIELKKFVGKDIDAQAFRNAQTIGDIGEIIYRL
jgi:acyl carrier protein